MISVPGSCGELAQGISEDGIDLLITCPISWYSKVIFSFSNEHINNTENYKSYNAVEKFLKKHSCDQSFILQILSDLPRGKGMASSSADIAAACAAAANAMNIDLDIKEIEKIALEIEPSDAIFLDGIVAFDHVKGSKKVFLGKPPKIKIAIFDFGGFVDTVAFNKRDDIKTLKMQKKKQFLEAYSLIKEGIEKQNPVLIGKGATISSLANQAILYKPDLEKMILVGLENNALGVNIAHSGTVAGVLFDYSLLNGYDKCIETILKTCNVKYIGQADLISGGFYKGTQ